MLPPRPPPAAQVLDKGRVVESGTHAQLLASGKHYPAMWRRQQESSWGPEVKVAAPAAAPVGGDGAAAALRRPCPAVCSVQLAAQGWGLQGGCCIDPGLRCWRLEPGEVEPFTC
jgi:hypothetical protein